MASLSAPPDASALAIFSAKPLGAASVLPFWNPFFTLEASCLKTVEKEQMKLREYAQLLEDDEKSQILSQLDANMDALRSASPDAKKVMNKAFMTSRSMRGRK